MKVQKSTLTFLFTDIEGSTRLWEHQPEEMRLAQKRHDEILRQAVEGHGGQIFKSAGDGICAVFSGAPAAVEAAAEAQTNLYCQQWEVENPIRARMALHTGEVEQVQGDYMGPSLNHIGRLLLACHGGQTLLTLITEELAKDALPAKTHLIDLGLHRFRDLVYPEHVFQLDIEGLPDHFPPLKSLSSSPNNLPAQLTSFIGRQRELEEIEQYLSTVRLLTLTGPGGTGKTRLAVQAAADTLGNFPDGAWFIELAPITNSELIDQAVASELNIREQPGQPMKTVLHEAFHPKNLLLILDNCEHLVDACARFATDLLRACPQVKLLTTSREMLGIPGEIIFRVPSLSLPEPGSNLTPEELEKFEATRLFVERAASIQPRFKLTSQNAPAIAQICLRLDGIPLALELAAARVNLLSPEQIATRLDDRFRLLTGGSRTALPRQQTLELLFDWSYDLLSPLEQAFFRGLSVFSGGWTLEAAEAISGPKENGTSDVLDLLAQLVNKSLILVDEQDRGEARYHMLDTTRHYAQKKLIERGEAEQARTRHMQYYLQFSDRAWQSFHRGYEWNEKRGLWIRSELDNLRAAKAWALENDLDSALAYAGSFTFYWAIYGYSQEGRQYAQDVLQRVEGSAQYQGTLSPDQNRLLGSAWFSVGQLSQSLGQTLEALRWIHKAEDFARNSGDRGLLVNILGFLSETSGLAGLKEETYRYGEESIAIARQLNDPKSLAMTLSNVGSYGLISIGDFEQARIYIEESSQIFKKINDQWGIAFTRLIGGILAVQTGDIEEARIALSESRQGFQELGDTYFPNVARSWLADIARLAGDYERAAPLYLECVRGWHILGNLGAAARCIECLAFMDVSQAQQQADPPGSTYFHRAARLLGLAEALRLANQAPMNVQEQAEHQEYVDQLRSLVQAEQEAQELLDQDWKRGSAMGLEDVLRSWQDL